MLGNRAMTAWSAAIFTARICAISRARSTAIPGTGSSPARLWLRSRMVSRHCCAGRMREVPPAEPPPNFFLTQRESCNCNGCLDSPDQRRRYNPQGHSRTPYQGRARSSGDLPAGNAHHSSAQLSGDQTRRMARPAHSAGDEGVPTARCSYRDRGPLGICRLEVLSPSTRPVYHVVSHTLSGVSECSLADTHRGELRVAAPVPWSGGTLLCQLREPGSATHRQ